jgi:WD40 repeat protein
MSADSPPTVWEDRVDQVCDAFEAACQAGAHPVIEDYLQTLTEGERTVLVRELILLDAHYRRAAGDSPRATDYLARFPTLDPTWVEEALAAEAARPGVLAVPGYEILELIGRGGMGVVYKARQVPLNRLVALKMILGDVHAPPEATARFRREAETVARLQHANIVQIHEVGEHNGRLFLALEYVAGGSLAAWQGGQPQPPREAARLLLVLARAVQYAHECQVIHRDLKPANILIQESGVRGQRLTPDSCLKIADFGLAKRLDEDSGQTRSGALLGTPSYMAPEQAGGRVQEVGPAADVYALGAILYELLTGHPPFRGSTVVETLEQVRSQEPVRPRQLLPRTPRDLETICLKCLEKDPGRRYGSAQELAEELERFLADRPILARPIGALGRLGRWCRRNPALATATGLAVVGLVAAAIIGTVLAVLQGRAADQFRRDRDTIQDQSRKSERLAAVFALERGQELGERGEDDGALLTFARALRSARVAEDRELEQTIRTNLAALALQVYPLRATLRADGPVHAAALSPDGKRVLTGGANGHARLWEAATGRLMGDPLVHDGPVLAVAFSPDGRTLLTGSQDRSARLWSAQGNLLATLAHGSPVVVTAFREDSKVILTASGDGRARLWDATSGKALHLPSLDLPAVLRLAVFSPDGRRIVTVGTRPRDVQPQNITPARLWDPETGRPLSERLGNRVILAAAFSPDSKTLFTGGDTLTEWNASTGERLGEVLPIQREVRAVAYSPDGRLRVAGGQSGLYIWKPAPGNRNPPARKLLHRAGVSAVAFRPDAEVVATGSPDGAVRLWDVASGQLLGRPLGHQGTIVALAFSPDGRTLLTRGDDLQARLWDVSPSATGRVLPLQTPPFKPESFAHVFAAFSPDGTTFLTGGDGTIQLWDAATTSPRSAPLAVGKCAVYSPDGKFLLAGSGESAQLWDVMQTRRQGPALPHNSTLRAVTFSPDGQSALTTGSDANVWLWNVTTGQPRIPPLVHPGPVRDAIFSPDGNTILTCAEDGVVRLWDAVSGQSRGELTQPAGVAGALFSPDGKYVLTRSVQQVQIWNAKTQQPLELPLEHQSAVRCAAFAPDSRTIVTGTEDGTARIWKVGGPGVGLLLRHRERVNVVAFSPDGGTVLTATEDGSVRLWEANTGRALTPSLRHAQRVPAAAFAPDGRQILAVSSDHVACLWPVPSPLTGSVEQIETWVEVLTGAELDADGVVRELDDVSWTERRRRLLGNQ